MAFGIPGVTAPPQATATSPIDELNLPDPKTSGTGGGSCSCGPLHAQRFGDESERISRCDCKPGRRGCGCDAALGSALPSASDMLSEAGPKVAGAARVAGWVAGPAGFAATAVLTPQNAAQIGHEQRPGETEKHWLERTDPKARAWLEHTGAKAQTAHSVVHTDAGKPTVETFPAYTRELRDAHTVRSSPVTPMTAFMSRRRNVRCNRRTPVTPRR